MLTHVIKKNKSKKEITEVASENISLPKFQDRLYDELTEEEKNRKLLVYEMIIINYMYDQLLKKDF